MNEVMGSISRRKSMQTTYILRGLAWAGLAGALAAPLSAQADAMGLISFGAKVGTGWSRVAEKDAAGTTAPYLKHGAGYLAGLAAYIGLPMMPVAGEVDAFYAMRRVKVGLNADNYTQFSTKALEIPALVKVQLGFLFIGGGGFYSMGLGKVKAGGKLVGTTLASTSVAYGAESGRKRSDFGAVGALGFSLPLALTTVSIEGRYNLGLANLDNAPSGQASIKSRSVDVLVGLTF
jgi:hypothetical protein